MKAWSAILASGVITNAILLGCDPKISQNQITTFTATAPAVYTGVQTVPSSRTSIYVVALAPMATTTPGQMPFNYMLAARPDANPSEPLLPQQKTPTHVYVQGGAIAYLFRGWGQVSSEHVMTASYSFTAGNTNPPIPYAFTRLDSDTFLAIAFSSSNLVDSIPFRTTQPTGPVKSMMQSQYMLMDVHPDQSVTLHPATQYASDGSDLPAEVKTVWDTVSKLRQKLQLPAD